MLTLLARCERWCVLGDSRGRVSVVCELQGQLADLGKPIEIQDLRQVRAALSDMAVQTQGRLQWASRGLDVRYAFADGIWFVRRST